MRPRGFQHLAGLGGGGGHAGLGEHVLAGLQRGNGQRAVHIGPGADADGADGLVLQQLLPTVVDGGDVELVGHHLPGRAGTVGHRGDFDACDLVEAGDVAVAGVAPRADESDSDAFVSHDVLRIRMVSVCSRLTW